jgi:hypothetical protein
MSETPSLSDAITAVINAIVTIIQEVANTVSANASVIATVLVIGGLGLALFGLFRRIAPSVTGFFRGLFA